MCDNIDLTASMSLLEDVGENSDPHPEFERAVYLSEHVLNGIAEIAAACEDATD